MKYIRTILSALLMGMVASALAQDSLYIRYDDRFKDNKFLLDISQYDSIQFRAKGTSIVTIRRYKDGNYTDKYLTGIIDGKSSMVLGDPGLILWKPRTSDANYNNDYSVETNRWTFKHSKESEHFVVFWDKTFGEISSTGKVTGQVSKLTVDINDMLAKAEQFYNTNVNVLKMCVTGEGTSQLDHYKMAFYLIDQTEWLATGSGNDNTIGTMWVSPNTCQPVGSTIAHEIGHSFQYQTYCDNLLRGKPNDFKSGFRYGYPGSNGGCGFWEQCAQWQAHQDYPNEAIQSYDFDVWLKNCHRHFEHEWMRYASYYEQYYWTENHGIDALGRIWNESKYPEDANMAYMRLFLDNDYNALRQDLFEYAQHCASFDFKAIKTYVGTAYTRYATTLYNVEDGWKQIGYEQCPQPTGMNIIKVDQATPGKTVKVTLRTLPAGCALPTGDPGTMVDGDGRNVGTATAYNTTAVKGFEGHAFGVVALTQTGERVYSPVTYSSTDADAVCEFTLPERTTRAWVVVQGSPTKYFHNPWDDKEETDHQLPYKIKIEHN